MPPQEPLRPAGLLGGYQLPMLAAALLLCISSCAPSPEREGTGASRQSADYGQARARMVREQIEARGVSDPAVLQAMRAVPRHEFVPAEYWDLAYADRPLPIGLGQTISQPYIVALMTDLLGAEAGDRILEVGTGSGYQAAVAGRVVEQVYSIELLPELAASAAERLVRLGVTNVEVRAGDGYLGWPEQAPFDGILVTAGAEHVPPPLVEQLAPGARMIIPVDVGPEGQVLQVIEKRADGSIDVLEVAAVRFVPLLRGN
ncbi:MAG TPA: protein-L-isoaspartate(D-aspartate) O-methyltransferase [Longimicrobiales bacterium]|nr:protein-L-isoaspartate(D-aspartate) O-methyltransferase [Longimicrobiales bacterium]